MRACLCPGQSSAEVLLKGGEVTFSVPVVVRGVFTSEERGSFTRCGEGVDASGAESCKEAASRSRGLVSLLSALLCVCVRVFVCVRVVLYLVDAVCCLMTRSFWCFVAFIL